MLAWRQPFSPPLRGVLCTGPCVLFTVGIGELPGVAGIVMLASSALAIVMFSFFSGVGVFVTARSVVICVSPFWVHRIARERIIQVDGVEVRPFEDFGGWGMKGRSRGAGLLFSVGGTRVVRLRTRDSRTYLISCDSDPDAPYRVRRLLCLDGETSHES